MKKSLFLLTGLALMAVVTVSANAQTGCVNSPENPTVVLALVGSAGAFAASARDRFRARFRKNRDSK